jgi:hypothetical protein
MYTNMSTRKRLILMMVTNTNMELRSMCTSISMTTTITSTNTSAAIRGKPQHCSLSHEGWNLVRRHRRFSWLPFLLNSIFYQQGA